MIFSIVVLWLQHLRTRPTVRGSLHDLFIVRLLTRQQQIEVLWNNTPLEQSDLKHSLALLLLFCCCCCCCCCCCVEIKTYVSHKSCFGVNATLPGIFQDILQFRGSSHSGMRYSRWLMVCQSSFYGIL